MRVAAIAKLLAHRSRLSGACAAGVVVLVGGVALASASSRSDNAGSCNAPSAAVDPSPPTSVVMARGADGTAESTRHYSDGSYRVSRCDPDGGLIISQFVALIEAPGGGLEPAPLSEIRPSAPGTEVAASYVYPSGNDPTVVAFWKANLDDLRAKTLPPTNSTEG